MILITVLAVIVIVAIVTYFIWRYRKKEGLKPRPPPSNGKPRPPPSNGKVGMSASYSGDGSWWQVRDGDSIVASMGTKPDEPLYEASCPGNGNVIAIGNEGGPLFCDTGIVELIPDAEPTMLYGISGECPGGWIMDPLQGGEGIQYVCQPDIECVTHANCDPGHICKDGKCVPIPDF